MHKHSSVDILSPSSPGPLLLSCEHAGREVPTAWTLNPDEQRILDDHWGWDIGAGALTRALSAVLRAPAVLGRWSRLYCDLNRPPDHPELMREGAEGVRLSFNEGVDGPARQARLARVYHPFHHALGTLAQTRPPALLLSVHSFTPLFRGPAGLERRALEIGVLFDAHVPLAERMLRELRACGLRCEANQPYSGFAGQIYSPRLHGLAAGVPYLELEIRQDLLADPAGMERVLAALAHTLRALGLDASGSH